MAPPRKNLSLDKRADEVLKCGKDPLYFINNYCRIESDGLIDFKTWDFQDKCIEDFLTYRYNIVLKSRQIGMSTITAAYATWLFLFRKHTNILVVATKLATAKVFIRKVKMIIKYLPDWMNIWGEFSAETMHSIELHTGSVIKAIPTGEDAGRSEALSLLIVDEAAHIKGFENLWTGLKPTLSQTGGRAIVLSSPLGVGNMFHKLYVGSAKKRDEQKPGEDGCNNFNGIILPWSVVPTRNQEWFENECKDMSAQAIAQELECDFVSSGENVIGDQEMKWLRTMIQPPAFRDGFDRCLWIWKRPVPDHTYLIASDVSRGDAKDYSTFHILDANEGEIVAEYQGKAPPDRLAEMLDEVGRKYNNALVCVEKNSYGYATNMKLRDSQYPNIYFADNKAAFIGDFIYNDDVSKAGFDMNGKSKPAVIAKLEELLRNKGIKIYSDRFVNELTTFVWHNGFKAQAMKGYNDDMIISMAIVSWLYDATEYSKENALNNQILFDAMGIHTTTSEEAVALPEQITHKDYNLWAPIAAGSGIGNRSRGAAQGKLGKAWEWLLK